MRSLVGLADLARLVRAFPAHDHDEAAALLGFRRAASSGAVRVERAQFDSEAAFPASSEPACGGAGSPGRAGFLRMVAAIETGPVVPSPAPPPAQGLTAADLRSEPRAPLPPSPPLAAWSTLWPRLHAALHASRPGRDPDVAALTRWWARGECLRRIPRLERRTWTSAAAVWIDRSSRLTPFWDDQDLVYGQLIRICGAAAIAPRFLDAYQQQQLADAHGDLLGPQAVDPAVPVLVLGDLGFYGSDSDRDRWLRTARRFQRDGVRIAALVPCPVSRWDRELARAWNATPWERPSPAGDRDGSGARAEALLRLIAPTALAQPGLLRALRLLLPADAADASTEVDVWRHPDVLAADVNGLVLTSGASTRWRQRFVAEVPPAIQHEVSQLLDCWHGGWRAELMHAETLAWIFHGLSRAPGRPTDARAFIQKVDVTLCGDGDAGDEVATVKHYGRHLLGAFPDQAYIDFPELKRIWRVSFADVDGARLPSTIAPRELYVRSPQPPLGWIAYQRGDALVLMPASWTAPPGGEPGSPVATFVAAASEVWVRRGDDSGSTRTWLTLGAELPLHPGERITLRTDCSDVTLDVWHRASWAVEAGPDRHGLWAAFQVEGVKHRMRWIPPGRFLMGSPPLEAGHCDGEGRQHWVTITRGYWLGETSVTQALWRAVMSENPSRFVSDDRPVEQVSWDDCQDFLGRLNRQLDGLETRLPTEAEWERACRAGTSTATWVGDLTLRGSNDAPELDDIAWYGGNSGVDFDLHNGHASSDWHKKQYPHIKAGTHPVGRKAPNPYGLNDMLGNVFEWCQDGVVREYTSEPVVDPMSRAQGPRRVVRGGSWSSRAREVRAAYRGAFARVLRDDHLGFRLAGGQVSAPSRPADEPRIGDPGRGGGRDTPRRKDTPRRSPSRSESAKKRGA